MKDEHVREAIFSAIDEINQLRPPASRIRKVNEELLHGGTGKLDSLGLVNLIVATEMNLEERLGVTLNLADDHALSQEESPFRTVDTFATYINQRLEAVTNGQ